MTEKLFQTTRKTLLLMSMTEKFLQMMRSKFQSYTGEETLTHERSENEEENDESQDKDEATTDRSIIVTAISTQQNK